jgi:hypothetical protein
MTKELEMTNETFEVGKIKSWEVFVKDDLSEFEIRKGSQFEATLYLAYEEMCDLFRTADYQYRYKITALQAEITKLKDELRKEQACIDQIASPFIINRHFDSIKELVLERQKERREI